MSSKFYCFLLLTIALSCNATPQSSEIALLNNAQFNWVHDQSKWETFLDKIKDIKHRAKFAETLSKQEISNPALSPLSGAVAWYSELIRGLYFYGPFNTPQISFKEEAKNQDPITKLVRYLFHAPQEKIEISQIDNNIVKNLINNNQWPYLIQIFFSNLSESDFKTLCKNIIAHTGLSNVQYFTLVLNNARMYWQKPDEERDLPKETVEMILAAVWYAAIDKLDGRTDVVIDRNANQSIERIIKNLQDAKNRDSVKNIFYAALLSQNDTGKLTLLAYNRANHGYPPYIEQKNYDCASVAVKNVPDCVESTLHNIIDVLAYDPETQLYNPATYLPNSARINDYFNKQLNGESFSIPEVSASPAACQAWFNRMEKIPNAHYSGADRQNICELDGDTDNILTALKYLLTPIDSTNADSSDMAKKIQAANSLKDLSTALSSNNQAITFESDGSDYVMTVQKNSGDQKTELVVHLHLNKGHAEANFQSRAFKVFFGDNVQFDSPSIYNNLARLLVLDSNNQICNPNDPRVDGLNCSWRHLVTYTYHHDGQRACALFRLIAHCCSWQPEIVGYLFSTFKFIEEDSLSKIIDLFLSEKDLAKSSLCSKDFIARQSKGVLTRSVGMAAVSQDNLNNLHNTLGLTFDIGQLLIGAINNDNYYFIDNTLINSLKQLTPEQCSDLLKFTDDQDIDPGHQHKYNLLYKTLKALAQEKKIGPQKTKTLENIVKIITDKLPNIHESLNEHIGRAVLYAATKAENRELVDKLQEYFGEYKPAEHSFWAKTLYQAIKKGIPTTKLLKETAPSEIRRRLGEDYYWESLNQAINHNDQVVIQKLTMDITPEQMLKEAQDDPFKLLVIIKQQAKTSKDFADIAHGHEEAIAKLFMQELESEMDLHIITQLLTKAAKIFLLRQTAFPYKNSLHQAIYTNVVLAQQLVSELSSHEIIQALGDNAGVILSSAIRRNATNIATAILKDATTEEKKLLISAKKHYDNPLYQAIYTNVVLAQQLVSELSSHEIIQALGDNAGVILRYAIRENATNIVTAILKDATTEEKKLLISEKDLYDNPLYQAISTNVVLAQQLVSELSSHKIIQALGDNAGATLSSAIREKATNIVTAILKDATTEEKKLLISEKKLYDNPLCQAVYANNIDIVNELLKGLSSQEIQTTLGYDNFNHIFARAIEKNSLSIVTALIGGQKIRQAFNKETIGIILNLAIEKNATNIITTLIEGATQEDKKLLIQIDQKDENPLFNALKRNNIALAEQLIEGLSEQDIKQALKGILKDVLEMAKTKNATQVIAKLEEKTTEETKI